MNFQADVNPTVWSKSVQGKSRVKEGALWQDRDGEATNHSSEDGGSDHSERRGREGDVKGGLEANGMPRANAAIVEHQV